MMSFWSKFFMWLHHISFKPEAGDVITGRRLQNLFTKMQIDDIFISDESYKVTKKEDIQEFLKTDLVNNRKYVPERFDCDNFAFALMGAATTLLSGHAIGIVWANTPEGGHALNFFIDDKFKFWYIEPQTDRIFQDDDYKPYFVVL